METLACFYLVGEKHGFGDTLSLVLLTGKDPSLRQGLGRVCVLGSMASSSSRGGPCTKRPRFPTSVLLIKGCSGGPPFYAKPDWSGIPGTPISFGTSAPEPGALWFFAIATPPGLRFARWRGKLTWPNGVNMKVPGAPFGSCLSPSRFPHAPSPSLQRALLPLIRQRQLRSAIEQRIVQLHGRSSEPRLPPSSTLPFALRPVSRLAFGPGFLVSPLPAQSSNRRAHPVVSAGPRRCLWPCFWPAARLHHFVCMFFTAAVTLP